MIRINRAPVLTLWAAVVAERLGFDHDEALTLGKAVAGLSAQAKCRRLGIFEPSPDSLEQKRREHGPDEAMIDFMQRHVPVIVTPDGIRASTHGKAMSPQSVEKYIAGKFGSHLGEARAAMTALAKSIPVSEINRTAFGLYTKFRPEVPEGVEEWGAAGALNLEAVRHAADHR
jgi:hypothetical protein